MPEVDEPERIESASWFGYSVGDGGHMDGDAERDSR